MGLRPFARPRDWRPLCSTTPRNIVGGCADFLRSKPTSVGAVQSSICRACTLAITPPCRRHFMFHYPLQAAMHMHCICTQPGQAALQEFCNPIRHLPSICARRVLAALCSTRPSMRHLGTAVSRHADCTPLHPHCTFTLQHGTATARACRSRVLRPIPVGGVIRSERRCNTPIRRAWRGVCRFQRSCVVCDHFAGVAGMARR